MIEKEKRDWRNSDRILPAMSAGLSVKGERYSGGGLRIWRGRRQRTCQASLRRKRIIFAHEHGEKAESRGDLGANRRVARSTVRRGCWRRMSSPDRKASCRMRLQFGKKPVARLLGNSPAKTVKKHPGSGGSEVKKPSTVIQENGTRVGMIGTRAECRHPDR